MTTPFEPSRRPSEISVQELGLSVRCTNALMRGKVKTAAQLIDISPAELRVLHGVGPTIIDEVMRWQRSAADTWSIPRPVRPSPTPAEREDEPAPEPELPGPPGAVNHASPRQEVSDRIIQRDRRIGEMRLEGMTMREIAEEKNLSTQRVQQILKRFGPSSAEVAARREDRRRYRADQSADAILAAYREGASYSAIAQDLALDRVSVRDVINGRADAADHATRRANRRQTERRYSDTDLARAVRLVANSVGGSPTSTEYSREAAKLALPSLPTVANRFGSWNAAVRAAGLQPRQSHGKYTRRWDEDACWEALRGLMNELGELPTAAQYDVLASARDDLPSLATVRNRLGRWSNVGARLMQTPHQNSILSRIGVAAETGTLERDEAVWLSHLAGDVNDEELRSLRLAGLFRWHPSFGSEPEW